MTNTQAPALFAGRKWSGGATHVVSSHRAGVLVAFCTGRAMREAFGTDEAVTCKACERKATANGMDLRELGR